MLSICLINKLRCILRSHAQLVGTDKLHSTESQDNAHRVVATMCASATVTKALTSKMHLEAAMTTRCTVAVWRVLADFYELSWAAHSRTGDGNCSTPEELLKVV